jgi:hypothetical protein
MRCQRTGDAVAYGGDQLGALGVGVRRVAPVGQPRPALGFERDLAPVPRPPAHLNRGLEQRELVRPRREAALPAIGVQLAHDRHQRVIRRLRREIVEVTGAAAAAASDLEARRSQQERVQRLDRLVVPPSRTRERLQPAERFGVGTASVD